MTDLAAAIATVAGVRQIFQYDAYGNPIGFNPALAATTLLYSGEQFDALTRLGYNRARYYNPATATWTRLDPFAGNVTDPQSLHKYLYAHADPISGTDPSGLFTIGGFLSAFGAQMRLRASDASASLSVLLTAHRLKKFIAVVQRLYQIFEVIWDVVSIVQSIVEFLDLDISDLQEIYNQARGLVPGAQQAAGNEAAAPGTRAAAAAGPRIPFYLKISVKLPVKITSRLQKILRWAKRVGIGNRVQEYLGEAATAVMAHAVGFQTTTLQMRPGPQGIDQLRRQKDIGMWGIFEAKGGRSRLGHTRVGRQMSGPWIERELRDTIRRNPHSQDGRDLRRQFNRRVPMLASITRLNANRVRWQLTVHAQLFWPPNRIGRWRRGA